MSFTAPIKVGFSGDIQSCYGFLKFARNQASILETQMSFQKLNEGVRRISPFEGVEVTCYSSFGRKRVHIHVTPGKRYAQPILEKVVLEETNEVYYFIRIKCPDAEGYPLDLDGQGGGAALVMDRIILYDLTFDGGEDQDPTDETCRAFDFTPGVGSVAYDVDILNDIVYFPTGLTPDEIITAIEIVKAVAINLPTNELPESSGALFDYGKTFFRGRMSDPHKNALIASYASPEETVIYDISYQYSIDNILWPVMVDRCHGLLEAESKTIIVIEVLNTAWKFRWAPSFGGNPLTYINDRYWPLLSEVSAYYGNFCYYFDSSEAEWEEVGTHPPSEGAFLFEAWKNKITEEVPPVLQDGFFFTPESDISTSSFFCLFASTEPGWSIQQAAVFSGDYILTTPVTVEFYNVYAQVSADFNNNSEPISIKKIITPLEDISTDEILLESSTNILPCNENSIWFSNYENIALSVQASDPSDHGYYLGVNKYFHYPIILDDGGENHYYTFYKQTSKADTHRLSSFHAVEILSQLEGQSITKNFSSMLAFLEKRATYVQGKCAYIGGHHTPSTICVCNGEETTFANMPLRPYSAVGVVIYIFAPEVLYTTDKETGDIDTFWDIHTARRSGSVINPYRCLDLEEYVNDVLSSIQKDLDATDGILKLADGIAYTMNYYEFGITDGFAKKTTTITKKTIKAPVAEQEV